VTRCLWCNGASGELRTVTLMQGREALRVAVHPEHEEALLRWYARVVADSPSFVTIMAFAPLFLLPAIGLAALVSRRAVIPTLAVTLVVLAAFVWTHPYATPQTVRLLGVRRSITVVRAIAILVGLVAIAALLVGQPSWVHAFGL
jgi:hypothetical protein